MNVGWFQSPSAFGYKHLELFTSSIPASVSVKESKEPELPSVMIALGATAVRLSAYTAVIKSA